MGKKKGVRKGFRVKEIFRFPTAQHSDIILLNLNLCQSYLSRFKRRGSRIGKANLIHGKATFLFFQLSQSRIFVPRRGKCCQFTKEKVKLKGLSIAKMKIYIFNLSFKCTAKMKICIFQPPLKEIECNQSYCHINYRLEVIFDKPESEREWICCIQFL